MAINVQETSEAVLKTLDYVVLIDRSGSMGEPSDRLKGKTRLEEVQEEVLVMARTAEKYDDDGIAVVAFGSAVNTYNGVTANKVRDLFTEISPRGTTDLAGALQSAVDMATASKKETIVLVYTDGAPNDQKACTDIIDAAGKTLGRPRIGFTFVQVGNDAGAAKFLRHLDAELSTDVTAVVHAADAEGLTFPQLVELGRTA